MPDCRWKSLQDWNLPQPLAVIQPAQIPQIPYETWTGPVARNTGSGQRDQGWTERRIVIDTEIQSQLGRSLSGTFSIVKKPPA